MAGKGLILKLGSLSAQDLSTSVSPKRKPIHNIRKSKDGQTETESETESLSELVVPPRCQLIHSGLAAAHMVCFLFCCLVLCVVFSLCVLMCIVN